MQTKMKPALPGYCPKFFEARNLNPVLARNLARFLVVAVLLLSSAFSSVVLAASSREQAAEEAMMQHGQAGKVLSIREKKGDAGNAWYEVKILTDGNVSVYRIQQN